jgi:hypothetical protein
LRFSSWTQVSEAGCASDSGKPGRLHNHLFGSARGANGAWDESKRLAGQKARSDKAAARRSEIIRMREEGKKQADIALILGVNVLTVWRALKGRANAV